MSGEDPYDTLGVGPAATPEEIRAARDKLARATHPDRGGDPEAFDRVQRAYMVLADPVRRHRHDAGKPHDDGAGAADKRLAVALGQLFGSLVQGEVDLERTNVKVHLRVQLNKVDADIAAELKKLPRLEDRLAKLEKRMIRRKGRFGGRVQADAMIVAAVIKQQRQAIAARRAEMMEVKATQERVKAVLEAFDYQFDVVQQVAGWGMMSMGTVNRPF